MRNPQQVSHPIDPSLISAYYDDALDQAERAIVETHLAECHPCRDQLDSYRWLGSVMRSDQEAAVPASLNRRATALTRGRRGSRQDQARLPRPALTGLAMVGLAIVAILVLFPFAGPGGPSIAAAYPCDDPAECVVAVRFAGPIDRDSVERSVQLDPPVAVAVAWRGDTLLVKPAEPLQPTVSYTLSLKPQGPASSATPVSVHFMAGGTDSPVAMVTKQTASTDAALVQVSAVTATATSSRPPSVCETTPMRGFDVVSSSQPDAGSRLGCARAAELNVPMVIQVFKAGRLLRRDDRREIMMLLDDGTWRSYPDTLDGAQTETAGPGEPIRGFGKLWREQLDVRVALGAVTNSEQPIQTIVQEFERGLLIQTADQAIHVLYFDGNWASYRDAARDATITATSSPMTSPALAITATSTNTVTPSATATPTKTVTPSATATSTDTVTPSATATPTSRMVSTATATPAPPPPSVTPTSTAVIATATPSASACAVQPVRGLGLVYRDRPMVATRLGCARTVEVSMSITAQTFERGIMLWRSDQREIAVLIGTGVWSVYPDAWRDGDVLPDVGAPPSGRFAPQRSFGKLWRQQSVVRDALGWATAEEHSLSGATQEFANGWMIWTSERVIYVLYSNGNWQSFPDTFTDATATPSPVASETPRPR
ncbi:MAG: hypothetical protein EPO21_20775 [Chloroflexota bacterium]|nr:MAG: hypothetical protein EPO21_20775 [Chloroflexota bacterium]